MVMVEQLSPHPYPSPLCPIPLSLPMPSLPSLPSLTQLPNRSPPSSYTTPGPSSSNTTFHRTRPPAKPRHKPLPVSQAQAPIHRRSSSTQLAPPQPVKTHAMPQLPTHARTHARPPARIRMRRVQGNFNSPAKHPAPAAALLYLTSIPSYPNYPTSLAMILPRHSSFPPPHRPSNCLPELTPNPSTRDVEPEPA
jgi:hypothetical protein